MKRTPLYERHKAAGARFVDFGGWEMPVRYETTIKSSTSASGLLLVCSMSVTWAK